MARTALSLLCILAAWAGTVPQSAWAKEKAVIVVFDIKNRGVPLKAGFVRNMADLLASKLTATGAFSVVPREKLKKKISSLKKASYNEQYSQAFQVDLGMELAAQKNVATQIMKIGNECVVSATLFDLKSAVSQSAAISRGPCTEQGVLASLDRVAKQLAGSEGSNFVPPAGFGSDKLEIQVWTDRGPKAKYLENEKLFVFLRANKDCYVRLVYQQADGTVVQIFPNSLRKENKIKGGQVWVLPGVNDTFEFEVTPPFGQETIKAFGSTEPLANIGGETTEEGLTILSDDLKTITLKSRGIRVKKKSAEFAEGSASMVTGR